MPGTLENAKRHHKWRCSMHTTGAAANCSLLLTAFAAASLLLSAPALLPPLLQLVVPSLTFCIRNRHVKPLLLEAHIHLKNSRQAVGLGKQLRRSGGWVHTQKPWLH